MTQTASSTRTPEARRQSLCRVRKCIPNHADSYADTIEDLITKVTPRKKTALEEHSVLPSAGQKEHAAVGQHVQAAIQDLSNKKDIDSREARSAYLRILNKYGSMPHQRNWFAMNRKTLTLSKKPKEDRRAIKRASAKQEICAFFDDASAPLPDKKHVSKVTGKHRVLLDKPVRDHDNDYARRGGQAGFSTFASTDRQTYA